MEPSPSTWRFRVMDRSEVKRDPNEAEFFTGEGEPEAVVREAVQNSLDAKDPESNTPVRMRFALTRAPWRSEPAEQIGYFKGLFPHLRAQDFFDESGLGAETALVVEDFGTTGLIGDPLAARDEKDNRFYWFWRNLGRSRKDTTELGRWGVGKTAFPMSSRLMCFFGLTRRKGDPRGLLLGQSVLKTHTVGEDEYCPFGYYGQFEEDAFAHPISGVEELRQFSDDFDLARAEEPGLSIVVPFPRAGLSIHALERSVIRNFYYPILKGDLVVQLSSIRKELTLNGESVIAEAEAMSWESEGEQAEEILGRLRFARAVLDQNGAVDMVLSLSGAGGAPRWSDDLADIGRLEPLRDWFEEGHLVGLKAPVTVKPYHQGAVESFFDIYLQRDRDLGGGEATFLRRGLTIKDTGKPVPSGIRGLAVVEDVALASLLGDAESPAHTQWQERSKEVGERYEHGAFTVRFVNQSLQFTANLLSRPPEGLDEDLLADIFSLEEFRREEEEEEESEKPEVEVTSKPQPFRITRVSGGFRVTGNPRFEGELPNFRVRVAYDMAAGNPFAGYDEFDFRLGAPPLSVSDHDATVRVASGNTLDVRPVSADFEMAVTGFDTSRDLVVDVKAMEGTAEARR